MCGKPVTDSNGREITGTTTFTPETTAVSVTVEFEFDAETCQAVGKTLVVFEDVLDVYIHADIDDEGQTVTVLYSPKTGDSFPYLPAAACGIAVIGVFGTLAVKKKKRR